MKTVIIGNGIVALTIAFRLTQRANAADEIVIIGSRQRPSSATLAAAAMLNSYAEIEAGSLDSELDRYRFELSRNATAAWRSFEEELSASVGGDSCRFGAQSAAGRVSRGTFIVNNTATDDLEDESFEAIVAALDHYQEPYQWVSPRDIPQYNPRQRTRALRAILIENEGWLNPRLTLEKLDFVLQQDGRVTALDAEARRLLATDGRVSGAELDDGTIVDGDRFLLAAGATVSDILRASNLGLNVQRVFSGVGTSIEIKSPEFALSACIRTPNRGLACGVYSAPYPGAPGEDQDHVLIGASNFISPDRVTRPRLSAVDNLLRNVIDQINSNYYRAELVRVNVGLRPSSQDTYPMLGQTEIPNFFIATGTKRDGFHLSPLISTILADIMDGKAVDPRFSALRPDRPLIRALSRQQAIDKAVRHTINAAYQHGFAPPDGRLDDQIAKLHRDNFERLHDQVGAHDWGIPPEMLDMYRYGHAVA